MTFRTSDQLREVHPHPAAATAQLVHAYQRRHSLEARHINEVLAAHGPEFVVATLVQQLATAIRSPEFDLAEWVDVEIDRAEDNLQMQAELHIMGQDAEMQALGIPAEYRDRLRAWANGAEVEEIVDRLHLDV